MELRLKNGDYIPDGVGGVRSVDGAEALVQRVLFRLVARRGMFPMMPEFGSRLWQLGRIPAAQRQAAAKQYAAEALAEEHVQVRDAVLSAVRDGGAELTLQLEWQGRPVAVSLGVQI